jgi:hypothetical protein
VPNGVHMVAAGHLENLLEVIGRWLHLALEVMLSGGNELPVRIVCLVVVLTLVGVMQATAARVRDLVLDGADRPSSGVASLSSAPELLGGSIDAVAANKVH